MHDGGGDRSRTVVATKRWIEKLKEKGYRFKTVSELMRQTSNMNEWDALRANWSHLKIRQRAEDRKNKIKPKRTQLYNSFKKIELFQNKSEESSMLMADLITV